MKKSIKLILCIFVIGIMFLLTNSVKAASSSMSVNSTNVNEGDTIKVTVNINAAQWNLKLTANGKTLDSWTETVNYKQNLSKSFETSYKASEKGTVKFVLTGDITDVNQRNEEINTSKSVTVTEKSSGGSSSGGNTNTSSGGNTSSSGNSSTGNNTKPTFTSVNRTVYTTGDVNLRASWSTSSAATQVEKGTELKLTGTSSQKVNGYTWYRVEYKGATKYVASSLVTSTKPKEDNEDEKEKEDDKKSDNNNLSSLVIEGVTLSPEFNKDVLQYTAQVDLDVTKLELEAKAENSKATVKIEGNEELKEGENNIKITVTAEDKTTKTYTIKVTKGEILPQEPDNNGDDNALKLSELKILGVNFENGFDPDKYTYELMLNLAVNDLSITAVANQADAKVEILGNENFKEGENLVTIMLTSQDGTQTATYQIKVTMPADATNAQNDLQFYLICGGSAVIAIIAIGVIIAIYKRRNKEEDFEEEETIEYKEETEEPLFSKREEKPLFFEENNKTEKETKVEEKVTLDQFLDTSELEEEEKPRRSKGKHSM